MQIDLNGQDWSHLLQKFIKYKMVLSKLMERNGWTQEEGIEMIKFWRTLKQQQKKMMVTRMEHFLKLFLLRLSFLTEISTFLF